MPGTWRANRIKHAGLNYHYLELFYSFYMETNLERIDSITQENIDQLTGDLKRLADDLCLNIDTTKIDFIIENIHSELSHRNMSI